MFMAFLSGVVLRDTPLNSIQLLWVNLIMDTMGALALATEKPTNELLKRPPYSRHEYMITPVMWRNILCHGIYQTGLLLFLLFKGDELFGVKSNRQLKIWDETTGQHYTIFFNVFVFLQLFNEINARKLKKNELNIFAGFF